MANPDVKVAVKGNMFFIHLCSHSNHLFAHPLCEGQTLLRRIANVAFHILTLGIPLAIYHIVSCCFPRTASVPENTNLQETGINSILQSQIYSPEGREALTFAKEELKKHPEISPEKFSAGWKGPANTHQPVNQEIALLTTLFWDTYYPAFEEAVKQHKENPWTHKEVIDKADVLMKIGYAIGILTLEDLPAFTQNLNAKGEKRTYAEALTKQDSYQYRTFYYCTNVYHWIRGAITWCKHPLNDDMGLFYPESEESEQDSIPADHANSFYQIYTIQSFWKILYNDYCDVVRQYVDKKELHAADNRHVNWTQKDTGSHTFSRRPDTQPT